MNLQRNIDELKENGVTVFSNVFSKQKCIEYKLKFNSIRDKLIEKAFKNDIPFNSQSQYVTNYFRHDKSLLELVYNENVNDVLKVLLDENHVLIDATGINRRAVEKDVKGSVNKGLGADWHTDSRYLNGQRLAEGFSYLSLIMIDDFTPENGATHYVPGSHKRRIVPERNGNYDFSYMEGEAGSILMMDSGIWHKGGVSTLETDRWGVFNLYGPWFMKPYFRFPDMLGADYGKQINSTYRRLLHYNSTPPLNEDERMNTLVKDVEEKNESLT